MQKPLISVTALQSLLAGPGRCVVVDCSFDLADPAAGREAYRTGHLPGAFYLHLDNELSGPKTGRNGRHPLPDADDLVARLQALGIDDDTPVIAYDAQGGMFAARLWWLLRWIGHDAVAVLDGGKDAWVKAGLPLDHDAAAEPEVPGTIRRGKSLVPTVDADALVDNLGQGRLLVVDARAPDRFRGENETLDPVGGHIPGAVNRFFKDNLDAEGRFKPAATLRAEFGAVLGTHAAAQAVMQCGSGVTACHNLLALEAAGLGGAALYPGSWSEWCADPARPVATGATGAA